eukprot:gb/GECH01012540.1/.p1 GENE.gb/GECH01012540.1/~~gb/GECH01012540.1/.p1  ORF type:complete len:142 (+),score=14.71 gb/GECH01012540.1/:1-426(+)
MVVRDNASDALCNILGIVWPAYMSVKALESDKECDDRQWLTYWVVFSLMRTIEGVADTVLTWIPFYYEVKVLFIVFLSHMRGAEYIFSRYIEPFLTSREEVIDSIVDSETVLSDGEDNNNNDSDNLENEKQDKQKQPLSTE